MSHGSFATSYNLEAIENAYQRWRQDPNSVDESWRLFFQGFELGASLPAPATPDGRAQTGVVRLIYAYRDLGHFLARLDPLGEPRKSHPQLELAAFDLDQSDLQRVFVASGQGGVIKTLQHCAIV